MGNYLGHLAGVSEVGFIGFVETKIEEIVRSNVDILIDNAWEFYNYPTKGKSEWLLALWKRELVQIFFVNALDQGVIGTVTFPSPEKWIIALIYANKYYHVHCNLWNAIEANLVVNLLVLVGGAFNCYLS